jgi:hypothetical protein
MFVVASLRASMAETKHCNTKCYTYTTKDEHKVWDGAMEILDDAASVAAKQVGMDAKKQIRKEE